ncbi:MAG: hypothetical protein Q7T11_01395 [Deltaproteobacteria bacterium]|nr:hypothetical protein [Deltaproteobacteria bacterium]
MSGLAPANGVSAFGVVQEAENQLLSSEMEDRKVRKSAVNDKKEILHKSREERIENLHDRIKMLGSGGNRCLKFLKAITMIASIVATPFTAGASLSLIALSTAMTVAMAVVPALAAVTKGLEQLKEAMHQKKLVMNKSEGQQILAIIAETEKWIDDEKNQLNDSNKREKDSLDEYRQTLKDLEESFQTMIYV